MKTINDARKIIDDCLTKGDIKKVTFSSPMKKSNSNFKVLLEPKLTNSGALFYQFSIYYETKVNHENYFSPKDVSIKAAELLDEGYKQCDLVLFGENIKILTNKNYQCTILRTKLDIPQKKELQKHNVEKNYILKEHTPIPWLISLGIMDHTGKVISKYQKKFRQLNKFLEIVEDIADQIPENAEIIDVGCGKSYLTFALYYYFTQIRKKNIHITGLDLKKDVILECKRLAEVFGFSGLKFIAQDIEGYEHNTSKVDMVITLHACDTATDYALYGAVKWNAGVILSVPCCQHELFGQIQNDTFKPLLKHGILKERFSATLTDALRAGILEMAGYGCTVAEFIEMEHTPKNIMIKAIKHKKPIAAKTEIKAFHEMKKMFRVEPKLYVLLKDLLKI